MKRILLSGAALLAISVGGAPLFGQATATSTAQGGDASSTVQGGEVTGGTAGDVTGADVQGGDVTGGSVTAGSVSSGTATAGSGGMSTASADVGGRKITAKSSGGSASIQAEGDEAVIQLGEHKLTIEKKQLTFNEEEPAPIPADAKVVNVEFANETLKVTADGKDIYEKAL